ncbi:MAG TPA: indole-3-glycerol phosphate synthase TrpC [Acidobacteriota bacterium]|nr:indole-3-glycerol phosphate synthase TrpC [Acidobacteriota bacterium]
MLTRIIADKRRELAERKKNRESPPVGQLLTEEAPSFRGAISRDDCNVIAEIKYQSPSHGPFLCQDPPEEIAESYVRAGAAAISVLTDAKHFHGSLEHLRRVRARLDEIPGAHTAEGAGLTEEAFSQTPLLRKDFILDPVQVDEARSFGASAFLLIAACLSADELSSLRGHGEELGMDALVEVHDLFELDAAIESGASIIGVNNRNLRSFEVDLRTSFDMARRMEGESGYLLVAESGISEPSQLGELRDAGFCAFLLGTILMNSASPGRRLSELLRAAAKRGDAVGS